MLTGGYFYLCDFHPTFYDLGINSITKVCKKQAKRET